MNKGLTKIISSTMIGTSFLWFSYFGSLAVKTSLASNYISERTNILRKEGYYDYNDYVAGKIIISPQGSNELYNLERKCQLEEIKTISNFGIGIAGGFLLGLGGLKLYHYSRRSENRKK